MLSPVWLFATPRTVARQAPVYGDSPGKNTGVGSHALLQGIFPTQGQNSGLPNCRQVLYHLSHQGNPGLLQKHEAAESPDPKQSLSPACLFIGHTFFFFRAGWGGWGGVDFSLTFKNLSLIEG